MENNSIYINDKEGVNIYLHLKAIELILTNGITEPVRGILENDKIVIVKLFNNCEGNLTFINELICHRLANTLGLKNVLSSTYL